MNTNTKHRICGSIIKREPLTQFTGAKMENTVIAEANQPYHNYYGRIPDKPQPNSLFLFTERYYTLEEALRFTQKIGICAQNKVNVASAVIHFYEKQHPAIRIRNFPDYQNIGLLQQCYSRQGMKFARRVHIENEGLMQVSKCFHVEDVGDGFYMDMDEPNEGYFVMPSYPDIEAFEQLLRNIRNNSQCPVFDAAFGGFIMNGKVVDIMRVYSGHLDMDLLYCVRNGMLRWMESVNELQKFL
jgi:hypothetical protein